MARGASLSCRGFVIYGSSMNRGHLRLSTNFCSVPHLEILNTTLASYNPRFTRFCQARFTLGIEKVRARGRRREKVGSRPAGERRTVSTAQKGGEARMCNRFYNRGLVEEARRLREAGEGPSRRQEPKLCEPIFAGKKPTGRAKHEHEGSTPKKGETG